MAEKTIHGFEFVRTEDKTELVEQLKLQPEAQKFKKFKVTNEIIKLFGTGYTDEEYFQMWNKYEFLKTNYVGDTSMHTEALVTYVRYKVKEEMAIVANMPQDAKVWGDLAMKQAERAKINPNQFKSCRFTRC